MMPERFYSPLEKVIRESPLVKELMENAATEHAHRMILWLLEDRFGDLTEEVEAAVGRMHSQQQQVEGFIVAGTAGDVATFLQRIRQAPTGVLPNGKIARWRRRRS